MEFNPNNNIVKLCLEGVRLEEEGNSGEASNTYLQAWNKATNDFEKFLAAYYVARYKNVSDRLKWFQASLQFALKINDNSIRSAFASLYINIAKCCEELKDLDKAQKNYELANSFMGKVFDTGPFYHGTRANLPVGNFLTAGYGSNYKSELIMNHIYFTALPNAAGLAAALAKGEGCERVYIVEPAGSFENDPNVTDKKFPGNLTRSYRTQEPLKIVGEIIDWAKQAPGELQKWREKVANNQGEIIN